MELTQEICLKMKEERRKMLRQLPIEEKIRRVEELRERVKIIRTLRPKKNNQDESLDETTGKCNFANL